MNLKQLKDRAAPLTVDYDGEQLQFTYRPHAFSDADYEVFSTLAAAPNFAPLNPTIVRLVASWDLHYDGVPIPITEAAVADVPPILRMKMLESIVDDMLSRGNVRSSSSTSSPAGDSVNGLTGPSASTTPDGPASPHGTTPAYLNPVPAPSGSAG